MFRFRHHNQSLFRSEMNLGNVHLDYCLLQSEKGTRIYSRKQYNVYWLNFRNSIAIHVKYSTIVLNLHVTMEIQCRSKFFSCENSTALFILTCMCCRASDPTITAHLLTSRCPRTLGPVLDRSLTYLPTYFVTAAPSVELHEAV